MFHGFASSVFRSQLRSKGGGLTGTFEALRPRRRPRNNVTISIGDGYNCVVERGLYMRNTSGYIPSFFLFPDYSPSRH
jgi:hypothetical protein